MKQYLLIFILFILGDGVSAQTFERGNGAINPNDTLFGSTLSKSLITRNKWSLNKFQSLSTSIIGWRGGFATTMSAPVGLQVNRIINNNLYAFAGVSIAPTYISLRQSFLNTDFSKTAPANHLFRSNSVHLFPRAEVGLSFINDERTFQISGSMSVQRTNDNFLFNYPATNNLRWNGGPTFPR